MTSSRCFKEPKESSDTVKILLAGNPNTGKSVFFNRVTGIGVIVSNYPGTTVELMEGKTKFNGREITVIDLPGTYSLGAGSMDERVARAAILEEKPAVVINIVDAANLERNLYLTLQLLELQIPIVVALNMVDEARKRGIEIDHKKLSELLGVPVIPTIATRGEGIREVVDAALKVFDGRLTIRPMKVQYGRDIEAIIHELEKIVKNRLKTLPKNMRPRTISILLLEGDPEIIEEISKMDEEVIEIAKNFAKKIEELHGEPASLRIAKERYGVAHGIAKAVTTRYEKKILLRDKLDALTTNMYTGFPVMVCVWIGLFSLLLYGGSFLEELIVFGWEGYIAPLIERGLSYIIPNNFIYQIVSRGLILGLEAGLAVVVPYVTLFYIALAVLEDTGYLTRMAYLMDNFMHKVGLHGRAIIPLIAGYGCNVPAIMGTRVLETRRERVLAAFLITLIPCSARTVVILGLIGQYIGLLAVLSIYALNLGIIAFSGFFLNRIIKGETIGLVMELPPYRIPHLIPVLKKTWIRFREFVYIAFPLLILGSLVLSAFEYSGAIQPVVSLMKPIVVGILGLPALTGITLVFGVLRKEMTLEMLIVLFGTTDFLAIMNITQMIVFTVVVTLYFPCIATFAVLGKELGWKTATLIAISTIVLAILIGGITNFILTYL
ncbi:MAG: ferrous iron transport protein B [Candidatus Odinarchaeota archaeon]|nr:ferrous iron transport protein B [Candidatus Odinarchaeota archaeon]